MDQRLGDVLGVGNGKLFHAAGIFEPKGLGVEDVEGNAAGSAEELEGIFLGGGAEIPRGGAECAAGGAEREGDAILDLDGGRLPGGAPLDVFERSDAVVEEIEDVGADIKEQTAAGVGGGDAPGVLRGIGIGRGGRGEAVVDAGEAADGSAGDEFADFFKPRHGAAVVGDEEFLFRGGEGGDHGVTLGGVAGHGFLHVAGLAGGGDEAGEFEVRTGRRGDIHGIDLGIGHERPGIVIPTRHAVTFCVVGGEGAVAAHDGDESGAAGLAEAGAALHLGDIAAAEDAPADGGAWHEWGGGGGAHEKGGNRVYRPAASCDAVARWLAIEMGERHTSGMVVRFLVFLVLMAAVASAAETGTAFAARVTGLDPAAREAAVLEAVRSGNVPAWWRQFVDVKMGDAVIAVSPDYVCVGTDEDYWLAPLSPIVAQVLADELGCVLPTRKMVDAIWRAAAVKLAPRPIPPSAAMTTAAVFTEHNATVRTQRAEVAERFPAGALVAGHKKDVVASARLTGAPGKVAIYGWHRVEGSAIQPLYLGHTATWVDYSHGVRFVRKEMTVAGEKTTVATVLADPEKSALLSDEGPVTVARYPTERREVLPATEDVRVELNVPGWIDPTKPTRLVIYGAPAGNTIEQTWGRRTREGDDWHFDIQQLAAQTRWLRLHAPEVNWVVACVQAEQRSFVLWRRAHPDDHPRRAADVVGALRAKFPGAKLVLTGHSAGGAFTFGYLDGLETIPADVERIAFIDSSYAYDSAKGHGNKIATWLGGGEERRLSVLAYQDYVALLNGKTFVSENGGTWGRSHAMLRDWADLWTWTRRDDEGLRRHTALGGRVEFLLKENPEKAVLHTRLVEWNGFIHAMLSGTVRAEQAYRYLGPRVYGEWID